MRVRRRPVAADVRPAGCASVVLAFSVVFVVSAAPGLGRGSAAGAVLYVTVGVAGIVLCAGGLVTAAVRLLAGRPVLELDDQGVRLPAPWPWPRARDRFLRWADVAAVVLWSNPVPHGRRALADHLAFLPTRESAGPASPSAELHALIQAEPAESARVPGVATAHWALPVSPGWDAGVEEIIAEVRRHGRPAADLR
jgi:hypothetical protein